MHCSQQECSKAGATAPRRPGKQNLWAWGCEDKRGQECSLQRGPHWATEAVTMVPAALGLSSRLWFPQVEPQARLPPSGHAQATCPGHLGRRKLPAPGPGLACVCVSLQDSKLPLALLHQPTPCLGQSCRCCLRGSAVVGSSSWHQQCHVTLWAATAILGKASGDARGLAGGCEREGRPCVTRSGPQMSTSELPKVRTPRHWAQCPEEGAVPAQGCTI